MYMADGNVSKSNGYIYALKAMSNLSALTTAL